MNDGVFIALEGVDGSGKSTLAHQLAAYLGAAGRKVVLCREPGGTVIGEKIRDVLFARAIGDMTAETEALLFAAARAQLVAEVIRPALERGEIVIADRFSDSSLAYQWGGRGLPRDAVTALQRFATGEIEPHVKLLLDVPVETAMARRLTQSAAVNRIDTETAQFHARVREAYHRLAAADPIRWRVIDAARPEAEVWDDVRQAVIELVAQHGGTARGWTESAETESG